MSAKPCGCDHPHLCDWHKIQALEQEIKTNYAIFNERGWGQSRKSSLLESTTNIVVGYILAVLTQLVVYPLMGIHVTLGENFLISILFTFTSLIRSYGIRRVFNRWIR